MTSKTLNSIFKLCFITSFLTTTFLAVIIASVLYIVLRPFNATLYRKALWYLMTVGYAHVAFVTDWWSLLELNIYMDKQEFHKYFGKEHALLVINHSYDIHWLPLLSICARMNLLGNFKFFLKRSLRYIPILGWSFILTEYVLLYRSFDKDKKVIGESVKNFASYPYPIWLLLYPEGTWPTKVNVLKSRAYAEKMNLPQLEHHLQPRTTGFVTTLKEMRGHISAVYNIEIAFKESPIKPCCSNILRGKQMVANVYVKRIAEENIPIGNTQQEHFLREIFCVKDRLLASHIKTGSFFATSDIPAESHFKLERPLYVMVLFLLCCTATLALMLYLLLFVYKVYGFTISVYLLLAIWGCLTVVFNSGTRATVIEDDRRK